MPQSQEDRNGLPPGARPATIRCRVRSVPSGGPCLITRLRHEPNLTEGDERRYLNEYRIAPDPGQRRKALEGLWLAYGKLVVSMASKYRRTCQEFDDLISVGFLGLHDAIRDFDLTRDGIRLGTYAGFRIRHELQTYVRRNSRPVCLPDSTSHRQLLRHSRRLFDDAQRACRREGTTPSRSELCRRVAIRVGLPVYEVESTFQLLGGDHILLDDDQRSSLLHPNLSAASHEESIISAIDADRMKHRITALMDEILGVSERRVFQSRCMTRGEPASLGQLATEMGVSCERIYQLEASAKRKIAVALSQQGLFDGDPTTLLRETRLRASRRRPEHQPYQPEAAAAK